MSRLGILPICILASAGFVATFAVARSQAAEPGNAQLSDVQAVDAQSLGIERVDFSRHVVPVLYKQGCSGGTCHGSFAGKGGFQLSLFASRADLDERAVRQDGFGRRIDVQQPETSLLLQKPSTRVAHGGGLRLPVGSREYALLRTWIEQGALYDASSAASIESVRVEPTSMNVSPGGLSEPLKVLAKLADGHEEDVTWLCKFESLDPSVASMDEQARLVGGQPGDVAVLAHYAGHVAYTIAIVPAEQIAGVEFPVETHSDVVDELLVAKLRRLNIVPSPACTDEEFLRRARLDITSTLPTPEEVRTFLADTSPTKRSQLIDRLLADPLHNALWATKLCDMFGADNRFLNPIPFHDWFRNKLERNIGWDQIAYGILCATAADDRTNEEINADNAIAAAQRKIAKLEAEQLKARAGVGDPPEPVEIDTTPAWRRGYGTRKTLDEMYSALKFQRTLRDEEGNSQGRILDSPAVALQLSNALLGLQLTCAQCHKHPYDKWSQSDFYGLASVFTYLRRGQDPVLKEQKVRINGIYVGTEPSEVFTVPGTGDPIGPQSLGGQPIEIVAGTDPRRQVWEWMISPEKPYFARAIVNRVWAHYFKRGLFEPVDSQSAANPPSHPEVLDELARDFVAHKYDLRHLHRRILHLNAYARSWRTNPGNAMDERNFSHRILRRLTAEQLVDSISQITDTAPALTKVYSGEIRENARVIEMAMSRFRGDDWHTLTIFGKPLRVQVCDCERSSAPSLSQVMYLYNDESLLERLSDEKGRLKGLLASEPDDAKLLTELYLWTLGRRPTDTEQNQTAAYLQTTPTREAGFEDVLWTLLNRQEFLVNH
jgi:hypothetical protein